MTDRLTAILLADIWPVAARKGRIAPFVGPLNTAARLHDIATPRRLAAFTATVAVETAELAWVTELWGPTKQQQRYEPPGELADRLGNTEPGDGYRYRGRGLIQITGRANYVAVAGGLDLDCVTDPDRLQAPLFAALSAGWWWQRHRCNQAADRGGIDAVTRIVNGGLTAIVERRGYFDRALRVLSRHDRIFTAGTDA